MTPLKVLLVDDHLVFRKGVLSILKSSPDVDVVGEAADGFEAQKLARELRPDIILMDVNMPGCDGIEATRRILAENPAQKVVMLTVADNDQSLFEAIKSGASGYLLKNLGSAELLEALKAVAQGEARLSPSLASRVLREFARISVSVKPAVEPQPEHRTHLSNREREVLQLVSRGKTYREVAEDLFIAENTVKNHMRNILDKLHLANRTQAVAYAIREGIVQGLKDQEHK